MLLFHLCIVDFFFVLFVLQVEYFCIYMIDRFYQLLTEIWVARSPVMNMVNIVKSMSCGVKEIFQK